MTELNDELLVAYVDGQLAQDKSKAIERVLEEDEVAARRVESLRAANASLETAFDAMLAGEPIPVPADENEAATAAKPGRFGLLRRAALVSWVASGSLLAGGAAGFILYDQIAAEPLERIALREAEVKAQAQALANTPPPAPKIIVKDPPPATWSDDVAKTHALLSAETFAFGLESEGNMDLASFHLSKALGASFSVPALDEEGLTFHRAQLLQRDGRPFAQIAYMADTGVPVALYVKARNGDTGGLVIDDKDGLGRASWAQGELSLVMAGDLREARLEKIAKTVEAKLGAAEPASQDTGAPVQASPDASGTTR